MDDAALAALDTESTIALVTFRRSGVAVVTPVWFAARDGKLYVFSAGNAGKVKRLRNDPSIRIAACNVRGAVRGPWIEGRACRVDDCEQIRRASEALRRKYGWQMWLADFFSRLSGRINERAFLELDV
jgi:PPOX class probable F420-dependent enzyme